MDGKPAGPAQDSYGSTAYPVLDGLSRSPLDAAELARLLGVDEPEVEQWRDGSTRVPDAVLIFLTFLLAHSLDEMADLEDLEIAHAVPEAPWRDDIRLQAVQAERCLAHQEMLNADLPVEAHREGAALFRDWYARRQRRYFDS
ncbi:MAG: hypothetical protein ACPGNT_08655 [Rhodospirillales bacterium]